KCSSLVKQSPPSRRAAPHSRETVDSEVFDNGPFRPSYAMGNSSGHGSGQPYEISNTPIEVNESRQHRTMEIQNRIIKIGPSNFDIVAKL
ncbi:hypothetical protein OESDEN_20484, partial [Oesophagostomum dentatum]